MKKIVLHQYQTIINQSAEQVGDIAIPREGWLRTMRKALGISGAQLGRMMGVSRAQIAQSEKNEVGGVITLKTLRNMAEAMGGRLVYAIALPDKAEHLVAKRASEKAGQLIDQANMHMALESQTLDNTSRQFELERLSAELLNEMPSDLWDDL